MSDRLLVLVNNNINNKFLKQERLSQTTSLTRTLRLHYYLINIHRLFIFFILRGKLPPYWLDYTEQRWRCTNMSHPRKASICVLHFAADLTAVSACVAQVFAFLHCVNLYKYNIFNPLRNTTIKQWEISITNPI